MGHTLTLELPDDVYESLLQVAQEASQPPNAVAAQLLTAATQHLSEDPLERFIGAFDSRGSDWADRHDVHLGRSAIATSPVK
jgi:predicted transcriptional regulator